MLLFAYVSFCIAINRTPTDPLSVSSSDPLSFSSSPDKPRWFRDLAIGKDKVHPQFLQHLADSPISNFTPGPQRLGTVINVARCSWLFLVPYLIRANVPVWLYWGVPPAFGQPLDPNALFFAPRSHPQYRAAPSSQITPPQPVGPCVPSGYEDTKQQLPGESWREYMIRQTKRRKAKHEKEDLAQRTIREGREQSASKHSCPGKRGPAVYVWEEDNGVWTRVLITRRDVENHWGHYRRSQRIYNSDDDCWDLCLEFDQGTAGEIEAEDDSNDSDSGIHERQNPISPPLPVPPLAASPPSPMDVDSTSLPVPMPAPVASDPLSMDVDSTSPPTPASVAPDAPPMVVDAVSLPVASDPPPKDVLASLHVSSPAPVTSDSPSMDVGPASLSVSSDAQHPNPHSEGDDDEDLYDVSRQDVLTAYSFVALDPEPMPIIQLDDLLYYRYGFSLNERPYQPLTSGVSYFGSWTQVCRSVGGQGLESSALNADAVDDFLSILARSEKPFKDVPGKYWDLSPLGSKPLVDLTKVFISVKRMDFAGGPQYLISPLERFLHPERDGDWILSVDPMTALECIRRGLGPHTVDVANFLIMHGVCFGALRRIREFPLDPPVRPDCRSLGRRSVEHQFDLADFAAYEASRESFLRSQPHGPLALRAGGIIARLAREVLPNTNALSGPSDDALHGRHARFVCRDEVYVDDTFLESERRLICGSYDIPVANPGKRIFPQLCCY